MNENVSLNSYYVCEKCKKLFVEVSDNPFVSKHVYFTIWLTDKPNSKWWEKHCQCGGYLQFERMCWGGIILCA